MNTNKLATMYSKFKGKNSKEDEWFLRQFRWLVPSDENYKFNDMEDNIAYISNELCKKCDWLNHQNVSDLKKVSVFVNDFLEQASNDYTVIRFDKNFKAIMDVIFYKASKM